MCNGNDVLKAEDVYDGLHYAKGISNTQVAVVESDLQDSLLTSKEIKNVSSYHSIVYSATAMKLYRYYNIGSGVSVTYSNSEFTPSYNVKREFSNTQSGENQEGEMSSRKKRKRNDHSTCNVIFFQNVLCSDVFETMSEYEEHLLSENHTTEKQETAMDIVRASYVEKIKVSSCLHSTLPSSSESMVDEVSLHEALLDTPLVEEISSRGWALPQRTKFTYSLALKLLLFDIFVDGEKSGMKKSPEEVEMIVRQNFKPDQYVTTVQIWSLFSRWSMQFKAGTLKRPTEAKKKEVENVIEDLEQIDLMNIVSEEGEEEDAYQMELLGEAARIIGDISDWEVGDYVAVTNDMKWCPGLITGINEEILTVSLMECVNEERMDNKFWWPSPKQEKPYKKDEIEKDQIAHQGLQCQVQKNPESTQICPKTALE